MAFAREAAAKYKYVNAAHNAEHHRKLPAVIGGREVLIQR
jgi:hypothetical protein